MIHKKVLMFVLIFVGLLFAGSGCSPTTGSVIVTEKPSNTSFDISYEEWNAEGKCEMSLAKGEEVRVEIACVSGEISLSLLGKKGSEPYTGNNLTSNSFVVTVSETDTYVFSFSGSKASGTMTLTNLSK